MVYEDSYNLKFDSQDKVWNVQGELSGTFISKLDDYHEIDSSVDPTGNQSKFYYFKQHLHMDKFIKKNIL